METPRPAERRRPAPPATAAVQSPVRWAALAWLGILIAIGAVQVVREQWFDALVFFGAALVLGMDLAGWLPVGRTRARAGVGWMVMAASVIAVVLALLPRHGPAMMAVVGAVGITGVVLAWPRARRAPHPPWPRALTRLAWAWAILFVVGCLWELLEFVLGRIDPTLVSFALSDLVDPLVGSLPGHVLFVVLWLAFGLFLIRRGGRA